MYRFVNVGDNELQRILDERESLNNKNNNNKQSSVCWGIPEVLQRKNVYF